MPMPLEDRVLSGSPHPIDLQWLAFLDMAFRDVAIHGFAKQGMSSEMTARFLSLVALNARFNQAETVNG